MGNEYRVDLGAILGEFRLLVAVSGILFGFLLNVSSSRLIASADEQLVLLMALSFASVSVVIFLLPVIYHHLHSFPLTEAESTKIYYRSHRFILWGLTALIVAIYFSLILSFYPLMGYGSYVVAAIIMLVPAILFMMRKVKIPYSPQPKK
ncbi:MAG: hypothetical protein HYY22_00680 [Thaumarchaeota archaeon]|nr:hypothetical protein [Nitrososphaerota archaeon]